ncbi:MAG: hypothetical protein V5A68_07920 [Candidatus Thermoplasmatota archaeon]
MESNIVSYIMENLLVFIPIGVTGVLATVILLITGKDETIQKKKLSSERDIKLFEIKHFNIFDGVYLFIAIMLFLIGIYTNFLTPSLIGFGIACTPLILKFFYFFVLQKLRKRGDTS